MGIFDINTNTLNKVAYYCRKPNALLKTSIAILLNLIKTHTIEAAELNSIYLSDKEDNTYLITTSLDTKYLIDILQKRACGASLLNNYITQHDSYEVAAVCPAGDNTYSILLSSFGTEAIDNSFTNCMKNVLDSICKSHEDTNFADAISYSMTFLCLAFALILSAHLLYQNHLIQSQKMMDDATPQTIVNESTQFSDCVDRLRADVEDLVKSHGEEKETAEQLNNIRHNINSVEEKFKCVFTHGIINIPVIMSSGIWYDKYQIRKYLITGKTVCLISNKTFTEHANQLPETSDRVFNEIKTALDKIELAVSGLKSRLQSRRPSI